MSTTPPGWYDDGNGAMRWWDGQGWTEHTHVPASEPVVPVPHTQQAPAYAQQVPAYTQAQQPYAQAYPVEQPKKKRRWLLPVIIGGAVLVLGGIGLAIFLVIQLFSLGQAASSTGITSSSTAPSATAPSAAASSAPSAEVTAAPPAPTGAELPLDHPATVAVLDYDRAYQGLDCDLFTATTTAEYRDGMTCEDFVDTADEFNSEVEGYTVEIRRVFEGEAGSVIVETAERYTSTAAGDAGAEYEDLLAYVMVEQDGAWLLDNFTDPSAG